MTLTDIFSGSAEGYALIYGDVVTDFGGFAYDYTRAVVDKKPRAYFCPGVDFYTRYMSCVLAYNACDEILTALVQFVCDTVVKYGFYTRVCEQDFKRATDCGIALTASPHIRFDIVKHILYYAEAKYFASA